MSTTAAAPKTSVRIQVQKFGTFLSNMIMPNIGGIIAWGLITALFIENGPFPNEKIATMVGPMITYMLPILIAYAGGKMVHDVRGGVVGAVGVIGIIMATSSEVFLGPDGKGAPMFLGAMIMGPLTAWVMKLFDRAVEGKIPAGFEMLVNNLSAGIIAAIMTIVGMFVLAPIVLGITAALGLAVGFLVDRSLLPLTSIFIEPAKVFFLNNAINHGVLTPLGLQAAQSTGSSVLFLLEANPGPGLGILLAYSIAGRGAARGSAPGAALIHFFGGIHEIYFPYVLMKPVMIVAGIAGGMTGVFLNVLFGVGLRAPAAPGSIIMIWLQANNPIMATVAVLGAAAVSFVVGFFLLKGAKGGDDDLAAATASMEQMKGKKSSISASLVGDSGPGAARGPIKNIVFACDAGMGSSAMGASVLRKKIQAAGFKEVTVVNKAISNLTDTFDLVVSHQDLTDRAKQGTPSAIHVSVDNFMASPRYDEVVELLQQTNGGAPAPAAPAEAPAPAPASALATAAADVASTEPAEAHEVDEADAVLKLSSIVLEGTATDRDGAITEAGNLLVASGNVGSGYVAAMHEREKSVSTYMGNLLAIPHGTNEAKSMITKSSISVVRYPNGIDWNGNPVKFVIGIAGAGNDHLELLGKIAEVFLDEQQIAGLEQAASPAQVRDAFGKVNG
ncbi:MAG: PTS mannitol transporter subunit IICBA [Micropruina sp.]|uniref:PTS mannitol transporter subunit IICBA n=1 Tax=Micropruina sp. TaxID=2737536 RepID=UPI0039E4BA91